MIVQKFGGSSVGTLEKIKLVANFVKEKLKSEKKIIVVLSAMSGETDKLILLSEKLGESDDKREFDQLVNLGEIKTISLLAIALKQLGVKAISLTGWQAGILTNNVFGCAQINRIKISKIKNKLKKFDVVVVAGFQGITKNNNITTLGKGGSDTTAVALASKFNCKCEIYTDVCGVFSADPKIISNAKQIKKISYDELMEMSVCGAKVMESRSTEIAKTHKVNLWIGQSLKNINEGTCVVDKNIVCENEIIKNITSKNNLISVKIFLNNKKIYNCFLKFLKMNNNKIEIFNCVKNNKEYILTLLVDEKLYMPKFCDKFNNYIVDVKKNCAKISVIGKNITKNKEYLKNILRNINKLNLVYEYIDIKTLSICFLVKQKDRIKTIKILTREFGLENKKINLALVGATGLVGKTFLQVVKDYYLENHIENLYMFASENSDGKKVSFCGKHVVVEKLSKENILNKKIDYAFFAVDEQLSKNFVSYFNDIDCVVIDNSSAFRLDKNIPLIVPEVNYVETTSKIIANPNCSTIQVVVPLNVLKKHYEIKRVEFVTFQAVSGSGVAGIEDFEKTLNGKSATFYPYPIFNNCIPQIGNFNVVSGFSSEEMKMINETHKILDDNKIEISATCVRVPVKNCHSVHVSVTLEKNFNVEEIRNMFKSCGEGIEVVDEPEKLRYPINQLANGKDKVFVGRIRQDLFQKNILHFWCVADNIRKGAATNGVQILKKLLNIK